MSSFKQLLEQINDQDELQAELSKEHLQYSEDFLPLEDGIYNDIIMHRNVHFGGKFEFMHEYYQGEGPAIQPDFELSQIEKLAVMEQKMGQDIAPFSLTETEVEKVHDAIKFYQALRKLHSISQDKTSIPTLLVDLILSEDNLPQEEIDNLAKNEKAITYLIDLLNCEELFDPLFPGYGKTPQHVARALGKSKSIKAIEPLFHNMKEDNFIHEEAVILALKEIGEPAYDFLIKVLKSTPVAVDNEKAAIALLSFDDQKEFAIEALKLLEQFEVFNHPSLCVQLMLACLGLEDKNSITTFLNLKDNLPNFLQPDFQYVSSKLKKAL